MDRTSPRRPKTLRPAVGLDAPCRQCGQPIYYNYKGPVEGLCGKCTDRSRKSVRMRRSRRIGFFEGSRRRASITLVVVLALAAAAIAGYLILSLH